MISFWLNNNEYQFPDSWDELTQEQAISLVAVLLDYSEGHITASNARALWFCSIAKLDPAMVNNPKTGDMVAENIYRASRNLTFFFRIEYSKSIDHLSAEVRKLLRRIPPEDLSDQPEIRWARKLDYTYVIDATFARQLFPEINVNKKTFLGYRLSVTNGIINTSLTAQQYIDANTVYNRFVETNNKDLLDQLMAILYFADSYNSDIVPEKATIFKPVDTIIKYGILLNFQAFQTFLARRTHFGILWSRSTSSAPAPKISLGMADSIYTLAKTGYGSPDDLSHTNVIRFFELLVKNLADTVRYLYDNKVSLTEIADRTGLTVENIQKLI